ncbi:uncharacterized protein BCR38DRAFT_172903 [Pseudomassariella vexata]|uniref:Protein kinase domain-containing protein n=1 Tax=Pseudomassariella vexata TaxID=1141098 RepID=A0A1Y2E3M1_9PEZI|nr:uncharacterized protein BCR38DRAFT_172903 [Pseudomassariella vexata]ORY66109.1 hypothetical protein BCR38DRAFT_172903 [Pseudomassariella vexata]
MATEAKQSILNRMLSVILFCLIRTCKAKAYPPKGDEDAAVQLETIPRPGIRANNWKAHDDLHGGNIMLGDMDSNCPEHTLCPVVKLIDFGLSGQLAPWGERPLWFRR